MISTSLKISLRNIWKNKVFSAINIIGLALGLSCCIIIGLYIFNELSYDKFHHNYSRIARITEKQDQAGNIYNVAVTPGPMAPALQRDFPEIASTTRFGKWGGILKNGALISEEKSIQLTDNSIFKVFNFPLIKGNSATALLSPNEIVITEKVAEKYFGKEWKNNAAILGSVFRLNNQYDFKLAGITKNVPQNSSIQFDILLPIQFLFDIDNWSNKWNSNNFHTYILFKPGIDQKAFEKKIGGQLAKYNSETKDILQLQPLSDQYLYSEFDFKTDWGKRSNIKYVEIFSGVGILLLIIACVNFVNLSTARSLKRAIEVGVRKVTGASRSQLIFQFLSESVLIASFAGILAIVIINISNPWLQHIIGTDITYGLPVLISLLTFAGFVVCIGIIAGIYPAFFLSAFQPATVLKKLAVTGTDKRFRQSLVIIQFTIAMCLITCTFFMYRQLKFIQEKDLGFDKEQLVNVRLGGVLKEKSFLFRQEIAKLPGVIAIAPSTMSLADVDNSSYLEWEGMKPEEKLLITQANVDPNFIPTLQLQIVAGDNFSNQFKNDTANYILNESAVKQMGFTLNTVIGKQLSFWGTKGRVIGIVKDFHFKPLKTGIEPFILRYQPKERYYNLFVKLSSNQGKNILQQIQKIYKNYEVEVPFEFNYLNDSIDNLYADEKRTASVILLFSGFTIFVACLGLFGLAVFAAEQRIKEIGIRKILGADLITIAALLSKDFLKLVAAGIALAIPVAWYATDQWLQQYAYRITINVWIFVWASVLLLSISFFTVCFHALKVAAANPAKSIRTE